MHSSDQKLSIAGIEVQPTQLDSYFDFQSPDDIRLAGTRVGIENILYHYIYKAETPEEIVSHFSTITLEQVYAIILYYLHHKEAIDQYITSWLEWEHQMREEQKRNPSPIVQKLMKLKAAKEQSRGKQATSQKTAASEAPLKVKVKAPTLQIKSAKSELESDDQVLDKNE